MNVNLAERLLQPRARSLDELGRYQRRRRAVLAVLSLLLFLALLVVRSDGPYHEHVEAFGIGAMVAAILGRSWCTLYIGGRKNAEIVRGGPYSVTRNPLYVFSTIGAVGIGAMTGSVAVASLFGIFCYLAFLSVILVEEAYLKESFGQAYEDYMREVPRFFPNPLLFKENELLTVRPQLLYRTFVDGLFFLAAYPFFETVEYLQDAGFLPVLAALR